MDNEAAALLMFGVILYSALYAWKCVRYLEPPATPQSDARVSPNTAHPLSPSASSSAPGVSLDSGPYADV